MTLGNKIAQCRKALSITQDALAQQLGVTNQAVSKWESDQCCPDVTLLPKLADIFGTTIDELFGREVASSKSFSTPLSWPDDNILRVAVYVGHKMVCGGLAEKGYQFTYDWDVDGVLSCISVSCGNVAGNVSSGGNITCGNVMGHVDAGSSVSCADVEGNVDAGSSVNCGSVQGSVDAGTDVRCGDVGGGVDAGLNVTCENVGGDVDAGCTVSCGNVTGGIDAGGSVTIRK